MSNERTVEAGPGDQTTTYWREFEAPAARVFEAHVDPAQVAQWIGPRGSTLTTRVWDARTGGEWSYVVSINGEWGFRGTFHEVTAPTRIVQTWEFDEDPGAFTVETLTFTDLPDGRSRLEGRSTFPTVEARDAMLAGMDSEMDENFRRLDELLAG